MEQLMLQRGFGANGWKPVTIDSMTINLLRDKLQLAALQPMFEF
jgi:hypothetical protein